MSTPEPASAASARALVEAASARVTTLDVAAARALLGAPGVRFVDLRESAERARDGTVPGALHVPRGVLEFRADPASAWHDPALAGVRLVLFCAIGWRSALAAEALQDLGLADVCHLGGGFEAWRAAGGPVQPPAPDLAQALRIQARANRLANRRLHEALAALPPAEFHAPRTGFFPSLAGTLNHVLAVDAYYIGALHGETDGAARWQAFVPAADVAALAGRQRASDERLIAFCDRLDAAGCAAEVVMDRGGGTVQRDRACHVLQHLFMHQTHHRGQAHAMLSGTAVAPPQLDEFLMPSDAHLRGADMAALGWHEAAVYGS